MKGKEKEKEKEKVANDNEGRRTRKSSECGHCNKKILGKSTFQCSSCLSINLEECVKDISNKNKENIRKGKDSYICTDCVITVDVESLSDYKKEPITTNENLEISLFCFSICLIQ